MAAHALTLAAAVAGAATPAPGPHGLDLAGIDRQVAPGDDFFRYANGWRQKIREPDLRQRIVTNGHAPDEYRADTVRNLDPWYEAFGVKAGQKLYLAPADRVRVW